MLDNGIPTLTEPNALSSLVAPPSLAGRLAAFVAGGKSNVSETIGEVRGRGVCARACRVRPHTLSLPFTVPSLATRHAPLVLCSSSHYHSARRAP